MGFLAPYLPYLLPLILVIINEVIAHNPNIASNSLVSLILNSIFGMLKGLIGQNPPKP